MGMRINSIFLIAWVFLLGACGSESSLCDDLSGSGSGNAPEIRNVDLVGQLEAPTYNLAGDPDPWTAVFSLSFEDKDGDLGGGFADFYLGSAASVATSLDLADSFRQSGLAQTAESGVIGVPLRFGETGPGLKTTEIGMRVTDATGHRSNCKSLFLEFNVKSR
jgi:hypothetical protein